MKVLVELETEDIARIRESLELEKFHLQKEIDNSKTEDPFSSLRFCKGELFYIDRILNKLTF